jgi:hypothetical protein
VFWLARPPYWRRAGSAALVLAALWFELAPEPTVLHPFARVAMSPGEAVTPAKVEMRAIPPGLLTPVEVGGSLIGPLAAGEPLTPSVLGSPPAIPEGWWALEVTLPAGVPAGSEVRLVLDSDGVTRVVNGVVVRSGSPEDFNQPTALIAIPEPEVGPAAAAVMRGSLAVLVGSVSEAVPG